MNKTPKFTESVLELKMLQKRGMHNLFLANYYKTFFEDNKKKLNKIWAGIKEIININNKTPTKLGTLTTMESHNHFFCNIWKQIEKGIIPTQKTYDDFLRNRLNLTYLLTKKLLERSRH